MTLLETVIHVITWLGIVAAFVVIGMAVFLTVLTLAAEVERQWKARRS